MYLEGWKKNHGGVFLLVIITNEEPSLSFPCRLGKFPGHFLGPQTREKDDLASLVIGQSIIIFQQVDIILIFGRALRERLELDTLEYWGLVASLFFQSIPPWFLVMAHLLIQ